MKTLFITGYPGFLAQYLLKQVIEDHAENLAHIYLLVLPTEIKKAEEVLQYEVKNAYIPQNLCTIIPGDITGTNLAIPEETLEKIRREITHVFHLAAIYDLAVPEVLAERVNVQGTKNVNDWIQTLQNIERYIYFSTAYVSGRREGKIYEHELVEGQTFRNHYERTKYDAEILVQSVKKIVPTTIIRPGIVKGHSKTGATIKFDGLYFMLNFYDRLKLSPYLPYLMQGDAYPEGNFVPNDYVLQATSYLAMHPIGEGKTYHLTDPNPYRMDELQKMLAIEYLGRTPKGIFPIAIAKAALRIPVIRNWLRVEKEAMDYFTYHSSYDATQAITDLEPAGITCPNLKDTLKSMIAFYRKYKDDHEKHLSIFN